MSIERGRLARAALLASFACALPACVRYEGSRPNPLALEARLARLEERLQRIEDKLPSGPGGAPEPVVLKVKVVPANEPATLDIKVNPKLTGPQPLALEVAPRLDPVPIELHVQASGGSARGGARVDQDYQAATPPRRLHTEPQRCANLASVEQRLDCLGRWPATEGLAGRPAQLQESRYALGSLLPRLLDDPSICGKARDLVDARCGGSEDASICKRMRALLHARCPDLP